MADVLPLEPGRVRVLTNPLKAFLGAVGDAMRLNKPSLVMYGESRNGKSTALSELEEAAAHTKTWAAFRYYTEPFEQQGRAPKFFRGFRSMAAPTGPRFEVGSELDKLINSIRLACKQMDRISKGSCAQYSGNKTESYYRSIKFWKTPINACGNGQSNCMDLRAWTDAWTKIKG